MPRIARTSVWGFRAVGFDVAARDHLGLQGAGFGVKDVDETAPTRGRARSSVSRRV
jgi:hypothetical protein